MDLYAIEWGDWRDLLAVLRSFKSGHFVRHETVHYYQTACVSIDTERPLPTNVDGELVDQTPVRFALVRDALQVLVPRGCPAWSRSGSPPHVPRARAKAT